MTMKLIYTQKKIGNCLFRNVNVCRNQRYHDVRYHPRRTKSPNLFYKTDYIDLLRGFREFF